MKSGDFFITKKSFLFHSPGMYIPVNEMLMFLEFETIKDCGAEIQRLHAIHPTHGACYADFAIFRENSSADVINDYIHVLSADDIRCETNV